MGCRKQAFFLLLVSQTACAVAESWMLSHALHTNGAASANIAGNAVAPRPTDMPDLNMAQIELLKRDFELKPDTCGYIDGVSKWSVACDDPQKTCTDDGKFILCCLNTDTSCTSSGGYRTTCLDYPASQCDDMNTMCCSARGLPYCASAIKSMSITLWDCNATPSQRQLILSAPTDAAITDGLSISSGTTTPTPTPTPTPDPDKESVPVGPIVGGVVGGVAVVAFFAIGILYLRRSQTPATPLATADTKDHQFVSQELPSPHRYSSVSGAGYQYPPPQGSGLGVQDPYFAEMPGVPHANRWSQPTS